MITDIELFEKYAYLKSIVLSICESKSIEDIDENIKKKLILQYRDFVLNSTHGIYPLFLFTKYDEEKFRNCYEYLINGHSLLETDEYFINGFKTKKKKLKIIDES